MSAEPSSIQRPESAHRPWQSTGVPSCVSSPCANRTEQSARREILVSADLRDRPAALRSIASPAQGGLAARGVIFPEMAAQSLTHIDGCMESGDDHSGPAGIALAPSQLAEKENSPSPDMCPLHHQAGPAESSAGHKAATARAASLAPGGTASRQPPQQEGSLQVEAVGQTDSALSTARATAGKAAREAVPAAPEHNSVEVAPSPMQSWISFEPVHAARLTRILFRFAYFFSVLHLSSLCRDTCLCGHRSTLLLFHKWSLPWCSRLG